MINNISLKNFRGLKDIDLKDLGQLTLISGKNNSGKSSILEGIFLLIDYRNPDVFAKINYFRGLDFNDAVGQWEAFFYELNAKEPFCIDADLDGTITELECVQDETFVPMEEIRMPRDVSKQMTSYAVTLYSLKSIFKKGDYLEEGHFVPGGSDAVRFVKANRNNELIPMPYVHFINVTTLNNDKVIAEWFGKLELEGKKEKVIEILKIMDPDICDVSTIALRGQVQLYAKRGTKLLPLKLAGDGINKLLVIVLAIVENPGAIILIDEVEAGFHFSMYAKLWEVIAGAARENNCQVIASTHSYECIAGAFEGMAEADMLKSFCYYRVEQKDGKNRAFRYSGDLLRTALAADLEVR